MSLHAAKMASTLCPILSNNDSNIRVGLSLKSFSSLFLAEAPRGTSDEIPLGNLVSLDPHRSSLPFLPPNHPIIKCRQRKIFERLCQEDALEALRRE
jgi:hypothetical protein